MAKVMLKNDRVAFMAHRLAERILSDYKMPRIECRIYGWPRGGVPVAYLLWSALRSLGSDAYLVDRPEKADIIVDDIVDSGATRDRVKQQYSKARFYALIDKTDKQGDFLASTWVVFPWERTDGQDTSGDDIFIRLLQYIGEDVTRGGLLETPQRAMKAWGDWTSGYKIDPATLLKTFEDGAEGVDEMVTVQNIPVWSHCEHHLAPFFGVATVSYIPKKKVVGLSKLARVVDAYARRLQVQERLTNQIADLLHNELQPVGVGVYLRCRHLCMESRGVRVPNSDTITTALRGAIMEDAAARAEFLRTVNK